MFKLTSRSVVITGGGSGIGKAMSILFAKQGAEVHIIELNPEAAIDTVNEITAANGKATYHTCDVSNQTQVIDTFKNIGKIDILINNAGIAHIGRADNTSETDFDRIYNVNVKGVYNCLFAAIP
ncbi:MAG TPA: SDR family oxidoreductase, partial [Mucilaginibacter sp.]